MMGRRRWFTRSQWVFLIVVLNACLIVLGSVLLSRYNDAEGDTINEKLDHLYQERNNVSSQTDNKYYAAPEVQTESFYFDPNEADSTQLLRLGLAPFQVRSIYRYRAKGGRYSTKDDFRRVYRLTNEQWERISPLIRISQKYQLVDIIETGDLRYPQRSSRVGNAIKIDSVLDTLTKYQDSLHSGKPTQVYPQKLTGDETVDINLADSALLCRVPGIGSYYSRKIIQYRNQLGGYVSTEQLLQIEDFPADALAWLEVGDTVALMKLRINHLSTRKLMKHPYMGYYRASEIANYRRIHGPIQGIEVLKGLPHFSEDDVLRLVPYLSFE